MNHGWAWDDPRINTLLEEATQALGELNAFSRIVPDDDPFTWAGTSTSSPGVTLQHSATTRR